MFGLDGFTTKNKAKKGSGPKLDDENEEGDVTFSSSEDDRGRHRCEDGDH